MTTVVLDDVFCSAVQIDNCVRTLKIAVFSAHAVNGRSNKLCVKQVCRRVKRLVSVARVPCRAGGEQNDQVERDFMAEHLVVR